VYDCATLEERSSSKMNNKPLTAALAVQSIYWKIKRRHKHCALNRGLPGTAAPTANSTARLTANLAASLTASAANSLSGVFYIAEDMAEGARADMTQVTGTCTTAATVCACSSAELPGLWMIAALEPRGVYILA
jgi:hypothetical protein